ncbi:MAG: gliding motility-associated C-terminal domain-containing protein [Bacteroidales bacterium]|nr:gliding motility-associated C-terminal domain-containing protein [Bacteroidales bacterium]
MAQVTDSIIAPNVFTPNDDEWNPFFEVTSSAGKPVALKIFTRAGVLVFSIRAKICRWDGCSQTGEKMAEGVYFYTAEVPGSSPRVSKNGFVYLFR